MAVTAVHQVKVGETLVENVDGHPARTDSPEFIHARTITHKIVATLDPNPYGPGPIQCHHGGSLWVFDGTWRLYLAWAGIEWSAQFACDATKVEALRQHAALLTDVFPTTLAELVRLGYPDGDILSTPITDAAEIARYVDSIWNSCVPIPQPGHTGAVKPASPDAAGVHNYPEPVCALPRVMRDDFVPFVTDQAGHLAAVVPVAPRGSGDNRVRVLYTEKGHRLHVDHQRAREAGQALVLSGDHRIAQQAFAKQRSKS